MKKVLLVQYGEIALRGKNRILYENKLMQLILQNMVQLTDYAVFKEQGRLVIENKNGDVDYTLLLPAVLPVTGVWAFCPAVMDDDRALERLQDLAVQYVKEHYGDREFTFKVESKRADKKYPYNSQQISALVGGAIDDALSNGKVDVHHPELTLRVELRNRTYIYGKVIRGQGGLPAGSSGRGLLLLSGGIDSPVAGYLMAKRGVGLWAVYFHSPPYTSERAREKVLDLARKLTVYTGEIKVFVIPFTELQLYLYDHISPGKRTLMMKRSMLAIGEMIAEKNGIHCLITGDSIGQVASQTLQSILAVDSAVDKPIMRPLAGMDKQEIVDLAEKIDTFEISIRPYEDCCTIFTAKHPETRPLPGLIERIEFSLEELQSLREKAVEAAEVLTISRYDTQWHTVLNSAGE